MTGRQPDAESFFYQDTGLEKGRVLGLLERSLKGMDDGEIYFQSAVSENLTMENGVLKDASYNASQGFGLRGVLGEVSGYAHSNELSEREIRRAGEAVRAIRSGKGGTFSAPPAKTNRLVYGRENPLQEVSFRDKVKLLGEIEAYIRKKEPAVRQVTATLLGSWSLVHILRPGGYSVGDIRPLVRINVRVVVEKKGRMESGFSGKGGRYGFECLTKPEVWRKEADEALRQARVNLESVAAPAGEMEVVLGPGWPGILLHEAIGHGLEGDFNRKGVSAFSGRIGERVASKGITVVDDGTVDQSRGSLSIDDEGTPTDRTVLIEDGILKGYMQDRMNARLMGMAPTGNGRRESFAHAPMPRMTNTYMTAGQHDPGEIIARVKDGIYAKSFGGGQVDITNGKFVFSCIEAYRVKNGKLGAPLKGATLIGSGPEVLKHVTMVGNDFSLDPGIGTCGKEGQSIPAGVGQPTMLVERLTVGGTAT